MQSLFLLFFSPPASPSPRSKLMPHNTDRWIAGNRVRRFVLKYQRPAGDSEHSSVCLCLSFSLPPSLRCSFSTSVHPSFPTYLPPFLSLHLYLFTVCLLYRQEGGVGENLAQILGITYLTIFQAQMKHVKKKSLFRFKGQTLVLVKIDLWIYEFSPVVGAPL